MVCFYQTHSKLVEQNTTQIELLYISADITFHVHDSLTMSNPKGSPCGRGADSIPFKSNCSNRRLPVGCTNQSYLFCLKNCIFVILSVTYGCRLLLLTFDIEIQEKLTPNIRTKISSLFFHLGKYFRSMQN